MTPGYRLEDGPPAVADYLSRYRVAPLKSTAAFKFKSGTWDQEKKNKSRMDF